MKTSRLVGVLVITGIGIGALLSYLLPDFGFGLGTGGDVGIGNPPGSNAAGTIVGTGDESSESTAETPTDTPESTDTAGPVATVFVMIDGREYLLRRGPEGKAPYKSARLEQVVQAAQEATGDDNGIRVRIAQRSSSRETAERALRMKLEEAGIPGDAIRWKDEPTDSPPDIAE